MSNFTQVLSICSNAKGNGSKQVIKDALATLDETGQRLFKLALDPFLVLGVKKFDMPTLSAKTMDSQHDFEPFFKLIDQLSKRELTGNAAREAVTKTLIPFNAQTQEYLARIIQKDLKAGFSADTWNKVHPYNPVYIFEVQLADTCDSQEEFDKHIKFPALGEIKLDGERNICIVTEDIVYHSRNGKVAEHMSGLFDEELFRIRDYLGYDFILDGERMAAGYIETINAKKSGTEGDLGKKNMKFYAFFLMPLFDWMAKETSITTRENRDHLAEILSVCKCEKIVLTKGREVKDYHDMVEFVAEVTTPGYDGLPKGQEGLIIKDWNSTYEWDRSMAWVKVKNFWDFEGKILNWEFGKGRHAKRMGRVNVYGTLEDGTEFVVGVGSGFSDKDREDCAANFDTKWKDKILQGKYQEVSKGKDNKYNSLRFPTVDMERGFRDDKEIEVPEDVSVKYSVFPIKE